MQTKLIVVIGLVVTLLMPTTVAATDVTYTGDPYPVNDPDPFDQLWNIPNLPITEIDENKITRHICGEKTNGGPGTGCDYSTTTRMLFKETITPGTKFDKRIITIENLGDPHWVHLDILLCYRIIVTDNYPDQMRCDHIADDFYHNDPPIRKVTDSHLSDEIYVYIIARDGSDDDQTEFTIKVETYSSSNNDQIEPRTLSPGIEISDSVCQKDCDTSSLEDSSDVYEIDYIKGDSFTVEFWSIECEPTTGNINYQISVLMRATVPNKVHNSSQTKWQLNERDCSRYDGYSSINISNIDHSGKISFRFTATTDHGDFNPADYSIVLSHYDTTLRDVYWDYDQDGYSDYDEYLCQTNYYYSVEYPADLDGDGVCDHVDQDDDGDGVDDSDDDCPETYFEQNENEYSDHDLDGCQNLIDSDDDNDGIYDEDDNCSLGIIGEASELSNDYDGDGCLNNEDIDDDNDSWNDIQEQNCETDSMNSEDVPVDTDDDRICDVLDNDDDNDGYDDHLDKFPEDENEWKDTDNDGIGNNGDNDDDNDGFDDSIDEFPLDPTQTTDLDGDGCGDNPDGISGDKFPMDSTQCSDSDNDGFGDNQNGLNPDKFPNDPTQWADTDNDGYGDNKNGNNPDSFPLDSTQWSDSDNDGYGDNPSGNSPDLFPVDSTQWNDTDGDGFGDNPTGLYADECVFDFGTSVLGAYGCPDQDSDGWSDDFDDCPNQKGTSLFDRKGCPDTDVDGFSDPDSSTPKHPNGIADAFPYDGTQWLDRDGDGYGDNISGSSPDDCMLIFGTSWKDRIGCLDTDLDGWSDVNDAFPNDTTQWNDSDNDGFGDNPNANNSDECPQTYGKSTDIDAKGCPDKDNDGIADKYDHCDDGKNEVQKMQNTCLHAVWEGEVGILKAQGAMILLFLPSLYLIISSFILRKND